MGNYRLSSFTIDVALKKDKNKCLLIQGYTGAIDIVSSEVIAFLKKNKSTLSLNAFPFSESTWTTLLKRKHITSKSEAEEVEYVKKFAELLHKQSKILKHFGFLVSYNCNFRCPYCYEGFISKSGTQWSKNTFDKELVDKVYSIFNKIENNRTLHDNSILLYGGEPLLKENKEIVGYIIEKGIEKGYTFSTITNGYDLNEYKEYLSPQKITQIQVTVDGWKEIHNARRKHKDAVDTFDRIIDNIKIALDRDIYVSVRMNSDDSNLFSAEKLKSYFTELGFYNSNKFNFTVALMVDYLQKDKDEIAENLHYMSRRKFCNNWEVMDGQLHFEDWGIVNLLSKAIRERRALPINSIYCAAQSSSYIFDPKGNIYSCWESLGKQDSIVGNYVQDQILWTPFKDELQTRNISNQKRCYKCKYAFLCKGGCSSICLKKTGNIRESYCNDYQYVFAKAANKAYEQLSQHLNI